MLTFLGLLYSLMTHVIVEHIDGKRVGIVNDTHLLAESAGMLVRAAYILLKARRNRRAETAA